MRTSVDCASAVASSGASSPALDSPSVSSTSTRDLMRVRPSRFARSDASLSLSTPSATASPMAVPDSLDWRSSGKSICCIASIATSWSSVSGTKLSALPAKQTIPTRSFGRPANPSPPLMKRVATSLSASRRLAGRSLSEKSSAFIDPLRSTTSSMATPSTLVRADSLGITGRARAITRQANAPARRNGKIRRIRVIRPRGACSTASSELKRTVKRARRHERKKGISARGSRISSQIDEGWKVMASSLPGSSMLHGPSMLRGPSTLRGPFVLA